MKPGVRHDGADARYADKRGISAKSTPRLVVILDALEAIEHASEMDIAGPYFHRLKGARKGEFAVRVTGNWRVTWKIGGNDVTDVLMEDYH